MSFEALYRVLRVALRYMIMPSSALLPQQTSGEDSPCRRGTREVRRSPLESKVCVIGSGRNGQLTHLHYAQEKSSSLDCRGYGSGVGFRPGSRPNSSTLVPNLFGSEKISHRYWANDNGFAPFDY